MVYAGSIEGTKDLDATQVYRKLFQAHLRFCGWYRFAANLCKDYFIYCNTKELKAEDEVMVIKVQVPVKDILQVEESDLPDLQQSYVENIVCQASEAHALITDVVKGKKKWRETPLEA